MRRWHVLLAFSTAALGLLVWLLLGGDALEPGRTPENPIRPAPARNSDLGLQTEIVALQEALEAEGEARRALEAEVDWLREELERLRTGAAGEPGVEADAPPVAAAPVPPREDPNVFDEARLQAENLEADRIADLRERYDSNRLDELYLRDQAVREGWISSGRYRNEIQDLRLGLREDLGEQDYDYLLYAMGQDNRVVVSDVLHGSPAEAAGVLPGDILKRYDGTRIFNRGELRRATTEGKAGSNVAVDVVRGGESRRVYLPRGPLGVTLKAESLPPQASR